MGRTRKDGQPDNRCRRVDGQIDERFVRGPARQLNSRQRKALGLFLGGMSVNQVCKMVGIHNDTFHIWQRDCKPFQTALREAINHVEDNVATDLKTCLGTAVATVTKLMEDPSPTVRLAASKQIFDFHQTLTAGRREQQWLEDMEKRLEALTEAQSSTSVGTLQPAQVIEAKVEVEGQPNSETATPAEE